MQKFRVISDLHVEFWDKPAKTLELALPSHIDDKESVLLVAGDLGCVHNTSEYAFIASILSSRFKEVLIIPGNHECYGDDVATGISKMSRILEIYPNVTLSESIYKKYDEVTVHGTTLWTDFLGGSPLAMMASARGMNDYRRCKYNNRTLTPEDTIKFHRDGLAFLDTTLSVEEKPRRIVFTHHAPSPRSVISKYNGSMLNSAFFSNLESFIADKKPSVWIHGHMHDKQDYQIDCTRILCNPFGYIGMENTNYDPILFI